MVRIRRAALSDLDGMELVEAASFEVNRFERGVLRVLLTENEFHTWVAEIEDDIVGYASIIDKEEGPARLLSIAVIPERRGEGVARALMERVKDHALGTRKKRLTLEVRISNVPAINLYLSEGFTIKGMLKDYYSRGRRGPEDALYMVLAPMDGD
jgi:ribosomal-protein-alanine N-acetyltransferase